jgi:hypothetical protein
MRIWTACLYGATATSIITPVGCTISNHFF